MIRRYSHWRSIDDGICHINVFVRQVNLGFSKKPDAMPAWLDGHDLQQE